MERRATVGNVWFAVSLMTVAVQFAGCSDSSQPGLAENAAAPAVSVQEAEPQQPSLPRRASDSSPDSTTTNPAPAARVTATTATHSEEWQRLSAVTRSAEHFDTVVSDPATGAITITPRSNAWYQNFRGGLLFRVVDGDFAIRTRVTISGRDGRVIPQAAFSLAGLLIRPADSAAASDSFVAHALGVTDATGQLRFQRMVTRNSRSQIERRDAGAGTAELLLARVGSTLWLLSRSGDGEWIEDARLDQSDLPPRLQVGLMAATDWSACEAAGAAAHNSTGVGGGNPDLLARFEVTQIQTLPASLRLRLADASAMRPAELVTALLRPDGRASASTASSTQPFMPEAQTRPVTTPSASNPSATAPQVATSSSPPLASPADELAVLNDEFEDPASVSRWLRVFQVERTGADQLERFDIGRSTPGWMTLVPHTSSWFRDWRGVLVHKRVRGDFIVTTHVRATDRSGQAAPQGQYSLSGIMIRTPRNVTPQTWRPGGENYIFLSIGAADRPGTHQFEVKTTINSDSKLEISKADGPETLIRVARAGAHFILLRKPVGGGNWIVHRRYHRPDMPNELQVGMTVYTDWQNVERLPPAQHNRTVIRNGRPGLMAAFNYFRFQRPQVPDELRGRALSNPTQVPDQQLLSFLGGDTRSTTGGRSTESR